MTLDEFNKDADAWAASLGMSRSIQSADGSSVTYSKTSCSAVLTCVFNNGQPEASVSGVSDYMWLHIDTRRIQYRHPSIEKYIDAVHDLVFASSDARLRIHHRNLLRQVHQHG